MENLRVFAYIARDYESAAEATSLLSSVASLVINPSYIVVSIAWWRFKNGDNNWESSRLDGRLVVVKFTILYNYFGILLKSFFLEADMVSYTNWFVAGAIRRPNSYTVVYQGVCRAVSHRDSSYVAYPRHQSCPNPSLLKVK